MNKLWGHGKKGAILACILEPANIHLLTKERKPILINLNDGPWKDGIPPKVQVILDYSETPIADTSYFAEHHPEMQVDDQRTPVSAKKRPHCPECKSTIEELGVWRSDESPLWLTFCYTCGCVFGVSRPIQGLEKKPPLQLEK